MPMVEHGGSGTGADARVLERFRQDFKHQTTRSLRVAPQQRRAWQTVERLLDATNRMMLSPKAFDELSLEMAAADAGVTPQSAYRYFANIDDLVRTSVRRMQAQWNARFLDFMLRQRFDSKADIANAAVVFIAGTYPSQVEASGKLMGEILRNYHDVDYDAAWTLSQTIVGAIEGAAPSRLRVAEMATGLTALWAIAKLLVLRDATQLGQRDVQDLMAAIFLAALNGSAALEQEM